LEGKEAGGSGEACGADGRAAGGSCGSGCLGAGGAVFDLLVEAGLELNCVVDGEADQDWQDGD
jgi:hypothetical protein